LGLGCPEGDAGAGWVSAPFSPSSRSPLLGGISAFPKGALQSPPGSTAAPGRWAARAAGPCCRFGGLSSKPSPLRPHRSAAEAGSWPRCPGVAASLPARLARSGRGANIKGVWEQGVCGEERAGDPAAIAGSPKGA